MFLDRIRNLYKQQKRVQWSSEVIDNYGRKNMRKDPFISLLIEKLNKLKRDQEVRETLEESLQEFKTRMKCSTSSIEKSTSHSTKKWDSKPKENKVKERECIQRSEYLPNDRLKIRHDIQPVRIHQTTSKQKQFQKNKQTRQEDFTIVGYCFAGNPVPYSTKVRGKRITLGHFKIIFNRKGHFRYFFKRYSNEFGTTVVFEEVTDDEDILPLWDNKIFALIEEVEEYRF